MKRKEIVRIYKVAKEHLVSGLNGPNVQQLVAKENNNAKGNVLVQGIVIAQNLLNRIDIAINKNASVCQQLIICTFRNHF